MIGSIEHLRRMKHANRGRKLLRTPGPVPFWTLDFALYNSNVIAKGKIYNKQTDRRILKDYESDDSILG